MGKSFAAAVLATLMVVAACGGDDDDGTAGEGDGSTATEPTSPPTATEPTSSSTEPTSSSTEPTSSSTTPGSTSPTPTLSRFETMQESVSVPEAPDEPSATEPAEPIDVSLEKPVGDQGCLYRRRLVVTEGRFEIRVNGDEEPLTEITESGGDIPIGADPKLLNSRGLYLYDTDVLDPLDVAFSLQTQSEVVASPVLLVTPNAHWILAPGSGSQATSQQLAQVPSADPGGPLVAVVDTGFHGGVQSWFGDSVQPATLFSEDIDGAADTDFEGHAMFIASVIRQFNPDSRVRIAGMPNLLANGDMAEFDRLFASHEGEETPQLTDPMYVADELELISGIDRLLRASENPEVLNDDPNEPLDYAVLNISGGTYQCSELTQSALTTWTALKYWYDKTEGTPVVAAAGNHDPTSPVTQDPSVPLFVPGQFGSGVVSINGEQRPLYGVQSVSGDSSGPLSRFSNEGAFKEVGEDLCGIRLDPTLGTVWGGSSFATAVASAKFTTGTGAGNLIGASGPAGKPLNDLPDQLRLGLGSCSAQG